jgi:hypothetical protein
LRRSDYHGKERDLPGNIAEVRQGRIWDYRFKNTQEIKEVLGIDLEKLYGFDTLSPHDQVMAKFYLVIFINGWGLEAREIIDPVSINMKKGGRFKLKDEVRIQPLH